ncbi:54s ribosomal protein mitochondrial-like [Nannochloropsis oceanica]
MSIRGVPQLRSLLLRYSDRDGSSRAIRDYIGSRLVAFAQAHEHVKVTTELKRNAHPVVQADYAFGEPKVVCVRTAETAEDVEAVILALRNTTGRKVKPLRKPVVSRLPSIQGMWDPRMPLHKEKVTLEHGPEA